MVTHACSSASRLLLLAALLGVAPASAAAPDRSAEPVGISEIEIEMDPRDAEVIFRKDKNDTSSFPVTLVEADGRRLSGRIGTKGGFSQGFEKRPLSIKLDPGNQYQGRSRIVLNSMGVDRSVLREALAWNLIHTLGMVAPPTGYAFLTVNGEDRGLFFELGWIGGTLFERAGLGSEGEMYDPVDAISCADLSLASVRDAPRCWDKIFPGDGNYDSLKELVLTIDREPVESFHDFARKHLHLESVINWVVVTAITSNTQTYNDEYFLFLSRKTGKWLVIPWSYDRSFGWNYEFSVPEPAASDNENFQYYYPLELGALNPLRDKLFNNPVTRKLILDRLSEIVLGTGPKKPWTGWFTPEQMNRRIDRILALRAPYLERDPFVAPNAGDVAEKVEAVRHYSQARYHYFRTVTLGKSGWVQDQARQALPAKGGVVALVDGWGYQLAQFKATRSTGVGRIEVKVRRGRPELAPAGLGRSGCVRRTWVLAATAAAEGQLKLEYLEENKRFSEIGRAVSDERKLALYRRDPDGWKRLPTTVNKLANTLEAWVDLKPGRRDWYVACEATPDQVAQQ